MQAFVACVVTATLCVLTKQRLLAMIVLLVALQHAAQFYPLYKPGSEVPAQGSVRIMSSNLLASNRSHQSLLQQVRDVNSQLIIFQEYTTYSHQARSHALTEYPYKLVHTIDSPFGIAVYSKVPFVKAEVKSFTSLPAVDVTIASGGNLLRVLGVHPIPPMSAATYNARNEYFNAIAAEVAGVDVPVIVAGDFNAVPWSWHFKNMLKKGELASARDGHGLKPTWPGGFIPLLIPIDHILYNNQLALVEFDTGDNAGSDHKPIWAELSFR